MMKKIVLIGTLITISCLSFRSAEQDLPVIEKSKTNVDLPEIPNKAFKRGEVLSYRMHYGFIDAGIATLTVTDEEKEFAGRKTFHVVGLGSSKGTFDFFFKVRDRYETYIDEKALVPWIFVRRVSEGGYTINQDYIFNHYTNKVSVAGDAVYDIQPNMQDMLSAFYYARNMDLRNAKEGDVFTLSCFMDKEIYPLKIKFIGREDVQINIGKFRCLKFRPIVQKGRVFKHEEDLNVWLTDDDNHIPIKGQADVLVGSIKLELTGYSNLANAISKIE
jgi:hypothetical protein